MHFLISTPSRLLAALAATAAVSGCAGTVATLGQSDSLGPRSTITASQGPFAGTRDTINALGRAHARDAGFSSDFGADGFACRSVDGKNQSGTFCDQLGKAREDPGDAKLAGAMFDAGVMVSDLGCMQWFELLAGAERGATSGSNLAKGLETLTTGVLGFTGAEPKTISLASLALGFSSSTLSSMRQVYMLAPNLDVVRDALQIHRQDLAATMRKDATNYFAARTLLGRYESTCSTLGVRRFITAAVERSSDKAEIPFTATARAVEQAAFVGDARKLEAELELPPGTVATPQILADLGIAAFPDPVVDGMLLGTKVTKENEAALKAELTTARRLALRRLAASAPVVKPEMLRTVSARAAIAAATLNGQTQGTSQRMMQAQLDEARRFNKIVADLAAMRDERRPRFDALPEGRKSAAKPFLDDLVAAADAARAAGSLADAENLLKQGAAAKDGFDKAAAA